LSRLLGTAILVALLLGFVACSPDRARNSQDSGEGDQQQTESQQKTVAPETTVKSAHPASSWDYVALGDSLAVGVGANMGYVARYANYIATDTGASVKVVNLGQSGQTSSQLLAALRNDSSMRRKLRGAEIITFNIGINDLGDAGEAYANGSCGGDDNRRCLRTAVERVKGNWDAIISELLGLRSTDEALIRTAGIGYTPRVDAVFKPYLEEVNRHIVTAAAKNGIPHAQPYLDEGYINPDGVHPNDRGYKIIAERLRELGYGPLES
jgi:lysophospholipase L1-like esterase